MGNKEYKFMYNRCDKLNVIELSDWVLGSMWCLVIVMLCLMEEGLRIIGVLEVIYGVFY